jgi:dipeptidyl aminopeptidase/acylaminoacyl peptidase
MSRSFLPALAAPPLLAAGLAWLAASLAWSAPAIVRGNLILDGIPEQSALTADQIAKLDAYLSARQARPQGFTAKGQVLIATRFGDVDELHLVDQALGFRRQVTFTREPVLAGAFSPDPNRNAFFYAGDSAGEGNPRLYYQRVGDATPRRLTDGKSVAGGALWSSSGREIAFSVIAPDTGSCEIDIIDPDSGALPRLAAGNECADLLDWSADDRKLLLRRHVAASEESLFTLDLDTGQKREIEPSASKGAIANAKFSRDGTGVYFISNRDGDFARLRYVNVFTAEKLEVSGRRDADVEQFALSRDGHYMAYVTNEGGAAKLNLLDLRAHQDLVPPRLPAPGVVDSLSFDPDGKRLLFALTAANQPRDAYVLDVAANRLEPWTASETGPLDRTKFVAPRLTQFPTFDRVDGKPRELPLYVYEPASPGVHPVLIVLHDGPDARFEPTFDPFIQYVVNELGFAVLAPNVRGSSGYGKSFGALARGALREDAIKDVGALLVWLALDSRFDKTHVIVSGAGYGGYMALAALVNYGERLRGAVALAPITDFIAFVSGTAPGSRDAVRAEYGDEREAEGRIFLRRISPLNNAERITRPVLLAHGNNDRAVPIAQSDQLVNRLRARNQTVWYLKATDEGGSFARWQNREAYYRAFAEFLSSVR